MCALHCPLRTAIECPIGCVKGRRTYVAQVYRSLVEISTLMMTLEHDEHVLTTQFVFHYFRLTLGSSTAAYCGAIE